MLRTITKSLLQAALIHTQLFPAASAVSFPPPSGTFNTSLTISELIDHHRLDPYAPTPQPRRLMISHFQPIQPSKCSPILTPYMDPITAASMDAEYAQYGIPAGTFESLNLQICTPTPPSKSQQSNPKSPTYPLLLFTPGLSNSRLLYTYLAQTLSSHGYNVITIDHPYDASIVTFPDNSTIPAADISTDAEILSDLSVRVKDISFVLDSLPRALLSANVGIIGHSLGGATAAQAILSDSRLTAGINLDGTFFGSVIECGLRKPFLVFAHEGKNLTTDASWGAIWPKLRGWKKLLMLEGSAHGTFTDLGSVVQVLGFGDSLPSEVEGLLGSIPGERAMAVVGEYVSAFFGKALQGRASKLLDGPSKAFPEVDFVES